MHFEGILDFSDAKFLQNTKFHMVYHTAILYMASTGLEQDFPCVVFSHREKPILIHM